MLFRKLPATCHNANKLYLYDAAPTDPASKGTVRRLQPWMLKNPAVR
jgi:hypothetical protein